MAKAAIDKETEAIKTALRKKPIKTGPIHSSSFLSSGSTLLNLAISGRLNGCFVKGKYHYIVGDSKSGKSFLSLTCLAEAANNPHFDDYRFIIDDIEGGAVMDIEKFFGKKVVDRIEHSNTVDGEPEPSATIQELYYNLDKAFEDGRSFIYIVDSMDGLSSESEETKHQEQKEAFYKGKETSGSYGDGKAKYNSSMLRRAMHKLRKSGSILIIISQTRDNIGFGAMFNPKTRSGGKALRFYATTEWWSSVRSEIKTPSKVRGKDREIGNLIRIDVKKNRISGKELTIEVPIYYATGIDDTESCIAYLIEEGHWSAGKGDSEDAGKKGKSKKGLIHVPEWNVSLRMLDLVKHVEDNNLEKELRLTVKSVFDDIQEQCERNRKKRYT